MLETIRRCDVCGEILDKNHQRDKSPTVEWDLRGYDICPRCAKLIDAEIVIFRARHGVRPASTAAQDTPTRYRPDKKNRPG